MKAGALFLFLASIVATLCRADLLQYADQIPKCGLTCLLTVIPASECHSVTNSTCICSSDELFTAVDSCMSGKCTVLERLAVARIDETACNKEKRHRTDDIAGFLVLDVFSLACVLARLIARYRMSASLEIDDWVVFVLLFLFVTFMVIGNYVRITAIGYDVWDLDVDTITLALKLFFIDELFYTAILALCRVCLLFFLIRVFSVTTFRKICWIVIAWVVVTAIIILFMTIFQCTPIRYNWEGWTGEFGDAKCIDVNALAYAAAAMGIAQDIAILLLPLPIIAQLNMPLRKRLLTLFMFSLGIFAVLTSCFRLRYLLQFAKSLNPTWDYTDTVIWTSLEVKVTVIVLCLPTIRVLFARLLPSIFGTTQKSAPTKTTTPKSGSARHNNYVDLSDGTPSLEPARQPWDSDIELDRDIAASGGSNPSKERYTGQKIYVLHDPPQRKVWV
ncbi:hypothetical protein JX266_002252 [Neoarthrinium moseri]|nr:hypothetical protein JX266_002252 [Neoarthrinium moseri]